MKTDLEDILEFCPRCFATEEDGSWCGGVSDAFCPNCGANSSSIRIPRWAVESIRRSATWVGKRYYPDEEDKDTWNELTYHRSKVRHFPGRSVGRARDSTWMVSQRLPSGAVQCIFIEARTGPQALKKVKTLLPYVPKKALAANPRSKRSSK